MTDVPITAPPIETRVKRVGPAAEDVHQIVDFMRPGVVSLQCEFSDASLQLNLKCVVVGRQPIGVNIFIRETRILPRLGHGICRIRIERRKTDAGLHVLRLVPCVVHRQYRAWHNLLFHAKEPVCRVWISWMSRECTYVLCSCWQRRVLHRIADRYLENVHAITGEFWNVANQAEAKLHRHVENATVTVNDRLTLPKRIPRESNSWCEFVFRRTVRRLVGWQKRLRCDVEVLDPVVSFPPDRVVLVSKSEIQG